MFTCTLVNLHYPKQMTNLLVDTIYHSTDDKGPTFPIVIHPPLPTPPTLVTPSLTPVIGAKQEV